MTNTPEFLNFCEADFAIEDFRFASGQHIDRLRLHYFTMGTKKHFSDGQISNAVLLLHNTTGSGKTWLSSSLADHLFGDGQVFDLRHHFCIVPDMIGFGRSSKPSDGLRARFPNYRYNDMVVATRRLMKGALGIERLSLILGLSMGGMLTWAWATRHPGDSDAFIPIACQPGPMSGRNWLQRRISIEAIRNDPEWQNGDYDENPSWFAYTAPFSALMTQSVLRLQNAAPSRQAADHYYETLVERARSSDANDRLYQLEASMDYDPSPDLHRVGAPLLVINFADDELNPPALGVVEAAIAKLSNARSVLIPATPETFGHRSALHAEFWQSHVASFIEAQCE